MQRDYEAASRLRLKRSLLDKLAQNYDFAVPPGMVELEFDKHLAAIRGRKGEGRLNRKRQARRPRSAAGEEAAPGEAGIGAGAPDTATGEQVDASAAPPGAGAGSRERESAPARPKPASSKPTRRKTRRP